MTSKAMKKFLISNPEFIETASVLESISKRVVFKDIPSLESYLSFIKLPLFKRLSENDFYNSENLKKIYEEIIKKESNGVERMIFELLCGRKIEFDNIKMKFLFYKEFPKYIDQFTNINITVTFEMQDLLFQKVYLHMDNDDKIEKIILRSVFKNRMFYILAFSSHLSIDFIRKVILDSRSEIGASGSSSEEQIKDWTLGLFSLPRRECYAVIASELLYSSLIEKMLIFRTVEDLVDYEKLSVCLLQECFNSSTALNKIYVVFLKLIELFTLEYSFKLKLLYSWLRFFIKINRLDMFTSLMGEMRKAKRKDPEFEIYEQIERYFSGEVSRNELYECLQQYEEEDHLSRISKEDITKIIFKDC